MNLLSRTYLAITRRPFKSILLFLIVFILGNLIIGSFITNRSIDSLEIAFKEKVGAMATIKSNIQSPTDENYLGDQQKINAVHDDLVRILEEIRSFDEVASLDYRTWTSLNYFNTFELFEGENCNFAFIGEMCHISTYSGVSTPIFNELANGQIKITVGRIFTQNELNNSSPVGIISQTSTLLFNGRAIKVGDRIPYHLFAYDQSQISFDSNIPTPLFDEKIIDVEIIGKYKKLEQVESLSHVDSVMDLDRHVFLPAKFLHQVSDTLSEMYLKEKGELFGDVYHGITSIDNILIRLESVDVLEAATHKIETLLKESKVANSGYKLVTSDKDFAKIMSPLNSMKRMGTIIFVVSLGMSILILSLIIVMLLRDRKNEIGIYMALGEQRTKIILQIVLETLIIALFAVSLAFLSANMFTKALVSMPEVSVETDLISNVSSEDVSAVFEIEMKTNDIVSIYGIMFITILLSSVVPTVYILHLNPKEVLM